VVRASGLSAVWRLRVWCAVFCLLGAAQVATLIVHYTVLQPAYEDGDDPASVAIAEMNMLVVIWTTLCNLLSAIWGASVMCDAISYRVHNSVHGQANAVDNDNGDGACCPLFPPNRRSSFCCDRGPPDKLLEMEFMTVCAALMDTCMLIWAIGQQRWKVLTAPIVVVNCFPICLVAVTLAIWALYWASQAIVDLWQCPILVYLRDCADEARVCVDHVSAACYDCWCAAEAPHNRPPRNPLNNLARVQPQEGDPLLPIASPTPV
jgi:hypothetical protein